MKVWMPKAKLSSIKAMERCPNSKFSLFLTSFSINKYHQEYEDMLFRRQEEEEQSKIPPGTRLMG